MASPEMEVPEAGPDVRILEVDGQQVSIEESEASVQGLPVPVPAVAPVIATDVAPVVATVTPVTFTCASDSLGVHQFF